MTTTIVSTWADAPVEQVFTGITRQVIQGERQTLVRYVYQPGSVFPVHSHGQEQITIVVSGQIEFEIAGQKTTLGPGQVAVIPPDAPHGARVVGDETVETFNSMSPRRATSPFAAGGEGS